MVKRDFWVCGSCGDYFSSVKPRLSLTILSATVGVPTLAALQYDTWLCPDCGKSIRSRIEHQPKPEGWQPKHYE